MPTHFGALVYILVYIFGSVIVRPSHRAWQATYVSGDSCLSPTIRWLAVSPIRALSYVRCIAACG